MMKASVTLLIGAALLFAAPAFAVDGVVLINQATVMAAGGFPYKITQPGSYKLSGNLMVTAANTDGIDITSDGVTLDLGGFRISGPLTCTGQGASISCGGPVSAIGISAAGANDVTVRGGSVAGFLEGVSITRGSDQLVEEIHATGNQDNGIFVSGGSGAAVVTRNTASLNGFAGIAADSSTVTENATRFNRAAGLIVNGGVYGSNSSEGNGSVAISHNASAVSQNNNDCDGVAC